MSIEKMGSGANGLRDSFLRFLKEEKPREHGDSRGTTERGTVYFPQSGHRGSFMFRINDSLE